MIIRLEEEKDYLEVENLIREAFWNVYRPGCYEHFIVHHLRKDKCFVKELDYVIELNQQIIASIVYAKGNLKLEDGTNENILLFGPVSVLPAYQHQGYGKRIINYTISKAKELGYQAIVITGNPEYYKKYGFKSCFHYDIFYEGMDKTKQTPFFMIKILDNRDIDKLKGVYRDPDCYLEIDKEELEIFDQLFPYKIKEKKAGQLE